MRSRIPRSAPMNRWSACASSSATCRQAARSMNRFWSAPAKPASRSRSIPRTSASSPRPTGRCTAARRRRASFSAWRRCCSASLRVSASSSCGERPKTPRRGRPRREQGRQPISAGWARSPKNYWQRPRRCPPLRCWRHCPMSTSRSAWMRSKTRIRASPAKSRKYTRPCAPATKSAAIRAFSSSPPTMKTTPLRSR